MTPDKQYYKIKKLEDGTFTVSTVGESSISLNGSEKIQTLIQLIKKVKDHEKRNGNSVF